MLRKINEVRVSGEHRAEMIPSCGPPATAGKHNSKLRHIPTLIGRTLVSDSRLPLHFDLGPQISATNIKVYPYHTPCLLLSWPEVVFPSLIPSLSVCLPEM